MTWTLMLERPTPSSGWHCTRLMSEQREATKMLWPTTCLWSSINLQTNGSLACGKAPSTPRLSSGRLLLIITWPLVCSPATNTIWRKSETIQTSRYVITSTISQRHRYPFPTSTMMRSSPCLLGIVESYIVHSPLIGQVERYYVGSLAMFLIFLSNVPYT
jgi:hypothetical protein